MSHVLLRALRVPDSEEMTVYFENLDGPNDCLRVVVRNDINRVVLEQLDVARVQFVCAGHNCCFLRLYAGLPGDTPEVVVHSLLLREDPADSGHPALSPAAVDPADGVLAFDAHGVWRSRSMCRTALGWQLSSHLNPHLWEAEPNPYHEPMAADQRRRGEPVPEPESEPEPEPEPEPQPQPEPQPEQQPAASPSLFVVSITGVLSERRRGNVLVKELPHKAINGEYVRSSHVVNGYPVYVKINGQQWTVPVVNVPGHGQRSEADRTADYCKNTTNRVCLMMNAARNAWILKASAEPEHPSSFARIRIPRFAVSKQIEDLAANQDVGGHLLELAWYPEATVSLKSIADTMAAIAETASTHALRKGLAFKLFACQGCGDDVPFLDFIVLQCGHTLFCQECHLRYCAHLTANPEQRNNCTAGFAVSMLMYNPVTEHSDSAPLHFRAVWRG
jgi:hypothetical protein